MRSSAFYLVPIALGALAYPAALLAHRGLDRALGPLEGAPPWSFALAYLVVIALPPLIVVIGGTAVAARLADRPDLGRLVLTAAGAAIAWSALLYLALDHLPARARAERRRADDARQRQVQRDLERTTRLGPITYRVDGRRLEIELPIEATEPWPVQVRISFRYWHAPTHVSWPRCDHAEDRSLEPGRTIVRAACEADWAEGDPSASRTSISANVYHAVTRDGRGLTSASLHASLELPGLAGPRSD